MTAATRTITVETTAANMLPGDVIAGTAGGPSFTVASVDAFAGLVIVDFADRTASPPIPNHRLYVLRPVAADEAERLTA